MCRAEQANAGPPARALQYVVPQVGSATRACPYVFRRKITQYQRSVHCRSAHESLRDEHENIFECGLFLAVTANAYLLGDQLP